MENSITSLEPEATFVPEPLTLEAIYEEKIFETTILNEPHWMRDGKRFSYLEKAPSSEVSVVWMYEIGSGERKPLFTPDVLKLPENERPKPKPTDDEEAEKDGDAENLKIIGYQWSPDEKQLLFARIPQKRASEGDPALYVYTLATGKMERITPVGHEYRNAKWSPDGKQIGFVREDDLYVVDLAARQESRLTDTANKTVYNGRFGWVYEEELEIVDGWAWSPDGKTIAYIQQDEQKVPLVLISDFDDLHIHPVETRYPKAGDPNPTVKVGLVPVPEAAPNTQTSVPGTRWLDLGADPDLLLARMQWTPQGDLLLQRLNRIQNRLELLKVAPATGTVSTLLIEQDKAWVDVYGEVTFIKGSDQFLWLSSRSGYRHLYLYDLSGKLIRTLTQGEWEVESVSGVDATHRMVYFTAARPTPMQRHLYSVLLDGGAGPVQISDTPGTHKPLFAEDAQHYLNTHSSRFSPPHTRLNRASGRSIRDAHANPMPKLQNRRLGEWEFLTFKTSDGVTLNAQMLRPADFDPNRRYPVLMFTYGGPGSQVVTDSYGNGSGLEQYLAQKGYLFVMVDGRGSGFRGRDFMKTVCLNLGHWEVNDQIEAAKWLKTLPYVDPKRIGIWGWSYGGYMACLCILRGADVFKAAVAVAPVTHWSFYDSIYTERYMRRPEDNPKGYAESAPLTYADRLKGKFLLLHGTADDNVHFQNSARLAALWQKQNKSFQTMFYPGKKHGLEGVSLHVFTTITNFFLANL